MMVHQKCRKERSEMLTENQLRGAFSSQACLGEM